MRTQTRVRVRTGRELLEASKARTPPEVERAAALQAALMRDPGEPGWRATALECTTRVLDLFVREVAMAEGPGGLFEQVLASQPRLQGSIDRIRRERSAMAQAIHLIFEALESTEPVGVEVPARPHAVQLSARTRTVHTAMDELVHEAWESDLGRGD